ncbi:MAG: DUF4259 domain-containing protein [Bacteroidota bacterium]
MGAWGHEIFQDDAPYDYLDDIAADPLAFFSAAITTAKASDYLEYDEGQAVLVAAAFMDNRLNQTHFSNDNEDSEGLDNVNNFYRLRQNLEVGHLVPGMITALTKVVNEQSELNELWAENEELYPQWKEQIEKLSARLASSLG